MAGTGDRRRALRVRGVLSWCARALPRVLVSMCAAMLAPGCDRAAPNPPAAPASASARIVALSPALAVTLRDLGLADRIVGRHAYDMVLAKSVPVCGDQAGIDYEAMLSVHPTHVLIEWGSRPLPERLTELAARHSWQLRTFTLLTLDQVESGADELGGSLLAPGERTGRDRALSRLRASLAHRNEYARAGRVLMLLSTSPVSGALGPGSFHHQVLERLGGVPALDHGSPYMELDAEDVLRRAPDAIVLIQPRAPDAPRGAGDWRDLEKRLGPLARLDFPAVRGRRVVLIDDPLALLPATSLAVFADELSAALQRWSAAPTAE